VELGNFLEYFKIEILGTLSSQLDTIKIKKKQEEENVALTSFCHQCKKMHPPRDFPINSVHICDIFVEDHDMKIFPSLLGLRAIYKGGNNTIEPSLQTSPKKPWQPHVQGMTQEPFPQFFPSYNSQQWNTQIPWKPTWPQQHN
jgi:hypothetical protein